MFALRHIGRQLGTFSLFISFHVVLAFVLLKVQFVLTNVHVTSISLHVTLCPSIILIDEIELMKFFFGLSIEKTIVGLALE
jgi:hypothetical protein